MDLLTVGDLMIDVRVETGALARGGDVHGRVLVQPGGSAANAAVWGAWAGARTGLHGKVGADVDGRTRTGKDGELAARALGTHYPIAVVKLGARGVVACVDGELLEEPADPVVEADPTGAGDAFDGVFLASLALGASPRGGLRRACR